MNYGFFTASELNSNPKRMTRSPHCGGCGLAQHCKSPKMKYTGKGRRKILVIGEAPGKTEDERNEQFVGKAGERLENELKLQGIDFFRDCWKTNAVRCHPKDNKTPDNKQIAYCRPALFREIEELKPESILLFGHVAAESLLGHLWGSESLTAWLNYIIPHQQLNSWISVHYHPSYLERQQDGLLDLLFRRHLKRALKKKGRPWDKVPHYEDEVEVVYKANKAISYLKCFMDRKVIFAFDYETNCLKPEYNGAEIVSCSFSNGVVTFAFPWSIKVAKYVSEILKTGIPKIASNFKFEERWTRHMLGHRVRNWDWDTMLAAHVLNNATGVTGLKFQAFVLLGQAAYDTHVERFLEAGKGQYLNRIREIPLKDLLVYNGMDSLCEYLVMQKQKRELRHEK